MSASEIKLSKELYEFGPFRVDAGKVLGVQYLVYGTINEWTPDRGGSSIGSGGVFGTHKKEAEVAISFALTDVANGQVLFTTADSPETAFLTHRSLYGST